MKASDLPPHVLANLDQGLAGAHTDLDMVIGVYRHSLAVNGDDVQAMIDTTMMLSSAPFGALVGMIVAATRRLTRPIE